VTERCTRCGADVEADDGFRLYEPAEERRAVFCRLEHVVPWAIRGPRWEAGEMVEPSRVDGGPLTCSRCGRELDEIHFLLVRHRGEHRIPDDFCSVDHLLEWAKAGGRWQQRRT
jgi:DNA-directed RNA polymerase subunit RPC12/RpoP